MSFAAVDSVCTGYYYGNAVGLVSQGAKTRPATFVEWWLVNAIHRQRGPQRIPPSQKNPSYTIIRAASFSHDEF